jgi:lipopolysaccharide transport system ATP-binding protein
MTTGPATAIRVTHLGKKYVLGGQKEKYSTIRDAIVNSVKAPLRRFTSHEPPQDFWALKDVSFDVEQGEVVGIIGRNGAGKSTLLKILSRITTPTEGTVDLYGRVGSLLEVGTGFHPELTGRENIYLSGSILGMKRREIDAKLDDIVKFSEIEKFLDTPVKRFSSGMYVRLAFAVAAHLEPEILLIDEVLAVGDAAFQKKCLGKMGEVAKEGRTVLFVSHNMGAIKNLCKTCILLADGKEKMTGVTSDVIQEYISESEKIVTSTLSERKDRSGNGKVKILSFKIENDEGNSLIKSFDTLIIHLEFESKITLYSNFQILIGCYEINSFPLFRIDSGVISIKDLQSNKFDILTSEINLNSVYCTFNIALFIDGEMSDYIINATNMKILENNRDNVKKFPPDLATILIESKFLY